MMLKTQPINISSLSNELFLYIFESDLTSSTLVQCMLCCKQWSSLASSVLYKHLVLTTPTLPKWLQILLNPNDIKIETFTLRITGAHYKQDPSEVICHLQNNLEGLSSRLASMVNLRCFSLYSPSVSPLPEGQSLPSSSIASIIDHLPPTCESLEISMAFSQTSTKNDDVHLCPSIRRVLPQLRFLRLLFPEICPEAFGHGFDPTYPSTVSASFKPIEVPHLERCVLLMFSPKNIYHVKLCGSQEGNVIDALAEHLQSFKSTRNAPRLERLWMVDSLHPGVRFRTFRSFVRRDVIANKSQALPYSLILIKSENIYMVRMPAKNGHRGMDLLSTYEGLIALMQGFAWVDTSNGARLPTPDVSRRPYITLDQPAVITRWEWSVKKRSAARIWIYENETGLRMLDAVEGGLAENCIPTLHIPLGWTMNHAGDLVKSE